MTAIYSEREVIATLRQLVERYGSQTATAKALGVSVQYLNDVLHRRRDLGDKILNGLNLEAMTVYHSKPRRPVRKERV